MKKIKKLLSVLLVATMVFTTFSMGISVSAESATAETGATADSPLEVVVTTNKADYGKFDVAEITVNVRNTGDETVKNISAEAIFDDLAPVDSLYSETSKKAETLKPGENFSFSYKATLSLDNSDVGFFSKIILWFVRLFNDGYTVISGDSEADIENVTQIKFGKVSADNKIKVWYELHNNFTEPNYDDIEIVDISLEYINSDEFKNLDIEEKKETVNNTLNDLAGKGYITQDSIHYNDDLKYFYYEYSSANWENYIFLELNEEHTQTTEDVGLRDFFTDIRSKARLNSSKTVFNNESFSLKSINSQSTEVQKNSGNAVIMYGLDSCGDISKDKNLNNECLSFLNGQANNWNNMNLVTTLYTDTTVALYKTALKNKNLIVIEEHGVEYGDKEYNKVSFILKEKTSKSKDKNDYSYDLDEKHICRINGRYAINPSFFSHYYKNQLKNSIIYFASCRGLGHGGVENYRFSEAFDAKCTLGFHNNVRVNYQMSMMSYFVGNLTYGRTTKFSLDYATNVLGEYGPNGEYAIITSYYSTLYEQYEILGLVKDEITNSAISGVTVEVIDNESDSLDSIVTATTDSNGLFSVKLPYGSYSLSFNHDNYEYYGMAVNVDTENVVLTEPVLLTRKTSASSSIVSGTVKDETTGNAISGVTVEVIDNESDSFDPVATATTNENGLFSVKLPYGSYSLSFNHDNYEYYGTTVNVDTENVVLTEPVLLTPKNSSGGNVEVAKFLGKDISEVIKEYGSNYVEESIEGGHFFVYNSLGFGITENAYAGLESKNVVAIEAITTNSYLYDGLYANMSYNELKTVISNVAKPQYYYNEMYGEAVYCTSFVYGQYLFYYEWSEYLSDDDICYKAVVMLDPNQTEKTIIDSGSCGADGDNVTWTLYDDGELVISGSGAMADYQDWNDIPWHNVRGQIKSVIIKNGIKRIGSYSFGDCSNLQNITIGESVESIGEMSLSATSLTNIIIPDSVKSIEKSAFFGCGYLESVILGKNVAIIGQMAFQRCEKLVSMTIPKSLSSIGSQAFYKCNNLKNVYYAGTSTNWANISMGSYNTCLTSATIHYNS